MGPMFRSLAVRNYRIWAMGALVSNVGTWMQRIAQDWLVLTALTHHDAMAVGIVSGLQFGPQLLFLPWTGLAADRLDRRKLLMATQLAMGLLALALGLLAITGFVRLWHVFLLALLQGCTAAFDAPVRQTFVTDLVGDADLPNAVGLNSTSFSLGRMVGPAVAGLLIAAVGLGWVFILNAASFGAVLVSLVMLRADDLRSGARAPRAAGAIVEGFRYVLKRADLRAVCLMLFLIGTFGLNFAIYISTMAVTVFHAGAGRYGLLTSCMAVGTIFGALLAARRPAPSMRLLAASSALFGAGCAAAAAAPSYAFFAVALVVVGAAALTFTTATNSMMQLSTEPHMRGRVMAIRLAIALGGTPLGAPVVGLVADHLGPRWALGIGAAAGFAAALVGWRHMRVGRLRPERADDRSFSLLREQTGRG